MLQVPAQFQELCHHHAADLVHCSEEGSSKSCWTEIMGPWFPL